MIKESQAESNISTMSFTKYVLLLGWEIYPVNTVIQLLNNWGQEGIKFQSCLNVDVFK